MPLTARKKTLMLIVPVLALSLGGAAIYAWTSHGTIQTIEFRTVDSSGSETPTVLSQATLDEIPPSVREPLLRALEEGRASANVKAADIQTFVAIVTRSAEAQASSLQFIRVDGNIVAFAVATQ